ncbi:MAG: MarR family transcriptional regulator [Kiritimatiellae bacterium]|nr:MarR family transcriptional regulator [Kiritimatiellia bacterium]
MIEAGGRTAQSFGLGRLFGQIYMLLYLSPAPLSLDDLVAHLGVSKASVSIACRQLESWGAVKRCWLKGDRKDYYAAEISFQRILTSGLLPSVAKKLESARIQIERSLSLLEGGGHDGEQGQFLKRRLKEADEYRQKVTRLLNNRLVKAVLGA